MTLNPLRTHTESSYKYVVNPIFTPERKNIDTRAAERSILLKPSVSRKMKESVITTFTNNQDEDKLISPSQEPSKVRFLDFEFTPTDSRFSTTAHYTKQP